MAKQDLKGKTAVVTGSGQGIGLEIAKTLAARGAHIMITDIRQHNEQFNRNDPKSPTPDALVQSLKAEFPDVAIGYCKADVTSFEETTKLMEAANLLGIGENGKVAGGLDILVNNAGIQHKESLEYFPIEKWDAVIKTNLYGVFYGMKAATPYLTHSKDGGRIFNIASVNGHVGSPEKAAYCAAKAAVENLTRVGEVDLRKYGISVNTISPGFLDTELARKQVADFMAKGMDEEAAVAKLLEFQKIKEFIPVSDVANIICNMSALPKAKALELSGRDLLIDNGWRDNVYEQRPPQMAAEAIAVLTKPELHANELREQLARAEERATGASRMAG